MNASAHQAGLAARTVHDSRWVSVVARNPKADGSFYYRVTTTGVYCVLRAPPGWHIREHVRFHTTCEEAEKAGFRPVNGANRICLRYSISTWRRSRRPAG